MNSRTTQSPVHLSVTTLPFAKLGGMECPSCGCGLDLCQPDPNQTDRFIATCPGCGEWSLVSYRSDENSIRVVSLNPVADELERGIEG